MSTNLLLAVFFAMLAGDAPRRAPDRPFGMLPHPSAYRMASTARAIVEGTVGDDGRVTVTRKYLVPAGAGMAATIVVPSLRKMPRQEPAWGRKAPAAIQPDSVLLFLEDRTAAGEWTPLHLHGEAARGVIWFEGERVWGYAQNMNPGPYLLTRWQNSKARERVVAEPAEVRQSIAVALAARGQWRDTLAVDDPGERAIAVAKWCSPSTSPDGVHWRDRAWPDLSDACDALGARMVEPLARIVRVDASADAVDFAVLALARLGEAGRAATPSLIARLRDLRGVPPIHLLRALRGIADPRAAAVLRDFIGHVDPFTAAAAGAGLHASGGTDAALLLVRRLPASDDDGDPVAGIAALLEVLHDIEPKTAEKLVRERFLFCDQLMMLRPWLRRLRDQR